jgi:uncharacterized glyoxalase superfamily protein PhnB
MTEFAANRFKKGVPCIPVKDCDEAIRYYCEVLGFKKDFDDAILGRDKTLFAGVSRGECELTLNQHDGQDYTLTMGCEVDDVDLLHEEFSSKGVTITLPPQDEPWGERHMTISDLYGHQLNFSSRK